MFLSERVPGVLDHRILMADNDAISARSVMRKLLIVLQLGLLGTTIESLTDGE